MNPNNSDITEPLLQVGGVTPLTTIDYPDMLAAVIFCQGCPWRCRYCHNSELVKRNIASDYHWPDILQQLEHRIGLLDAVVFSGGEPTLQNGLAKAINEVKEMGFKVGLHTAGCYPQRLQKILPLLDWVGLDIKALEDDYEALTGVNNSGQKAWQSLKILVENGVNFETRVTIHNALTSAEKLKNLLSRLSEAGIQNLALQHCQTDNMLDNDLGHNTGKWKDPSCIDYANQHFEKLTLRLAS